MAACGAYQVVREGGELILKVDCESCTFFPSIEDNKTTMALIVGILAEAGSVSRIIITQKREYEYDTTQTELLAEIARLYKQLVRHKIAYDLLSEEDCRKHLSGRYAELHDLIYNLLKSDPIEAYITLLKISERENNLIKEGAILPEASPCLQKYYRLIEEIVQKIQELKIIQSLKQFLPEYKEKGREIYKKVFYPTIKPDFTYTKLLSSYPPEGEQLDNYMINNTEVTIFKLPQTVQTLYHIVPPEFKLSEDKYEILDAARKLMSEYQPKKQEFTDPERVRQVFLSIGEDLLDELAAHQGIRLKQKEKEELTEILVRYTVGFGLIEVLLQDDMVQDITINSPMGQTPIFIVHSQYGDCMTNIISTQKEAESWASKLRIISGRPLDEANPILDTELILPKARARVAAITNPLNPTGLAYAIRRHRDKPWTLPLFMKYKMLDPLAAGIISFLIDGNRTILVAGTRSSGKTSLLGSLMVEIMRKGRMITIEDSVTGDSEIIIRKSGKIQKITIGKLIDQTIENNGCWYALSEHEISGNYEDIEVCCLDKEKKITFSKISRFIRHKVEKPIYEVTTRTGRKIKVTGDHSLFNLGEDAEIIEAKVNQLKQGDYLVTPRKINLLNKEQKNINLFEKIIKNPESYLSGEPIKKILKEYKEEIKQLSKEYQFSKSTKQNWKRKSMLPGKIIDDLIILGYKIDQDELCFKIGENSQYWMPAKINLDEDLLTLIGLWLADGTYDINSVLISSTNTEDRAIIHNFATKYTLKVKMHSDKWTLMINSKTLKWIFREVLELKGNAYTKRIPSFAYNLSLEQISYVLKGLFSGDGCVSDKEILLYLSSRKLLEDVQTLLLYFGIILRIGSQRQDKTHRSSISNLKSIQKFNKYIGILQEYKKIKLEKLSNKISTHDTTDIIPLTRETKNKLSYCLNEFNEHDYIQRDYRIGRTKLNSLLQQTIVQNKLIENLKLLSQSDIFFDQIKEIKIIQNYNDYVYDISVPEIENFICNNILAHNTLELPINSLKNLGYNIQSMKVAGALSLGGTTEVSASDGIRSTLRLGDSSLIVGEVRSEEAKALYEAMRVGALANVVAGTIHGDSPYGVFDRVVNDLNVPRTSFKATDIILVANPRTSPSGLQKWKRLVQITEVRKHWEEDPLREKGFVDLMKYDPKTDKLIPTDDLLHGDSEVIKSIASNVKEWAGNWEAVWDNIQLRAKIKETILDHSKKLKDDSILEADFVVLSNDEFHKISEEVKEEIGELDSKIIFDKWESWLKKSLKKR